MTQEVRTTPRLMTARDLSREISTPLWTVLKWAREGRIQSYTMGRKKLFDLEEVVDAVKRGGDKKLH